MGNSKHEGVALHNAIDDFVDKTGVSCVGLAIVCANGAVQIWTHEGIRHLEQLDWLAARFGEASALAFKIPTVGES